MKDNKEQMLELEGIEKEMAGLKEMIEFDTE